MKKIVAFRIFLFLAMVICFTVSTLGSFEKYIAKKTSISEEALNTDPMPLPSFSLCVDPPFQSNYLMEYYGLQNDLFGYSAAEG